MAKLRIDGLKLANKNVSDKTVKKIVFDSLIFSKKV
jgi:hypothetical protein